MKATRIVIVTTALLVSGTAFSFPALNKIFFGTYAVPKNTALAKSNCAACHVGKTAKLNPYGTDMKTAKKTMKAQSITPDVLKSLENLDSDKDGVKNIAEIKKGTLPGDPKSK